MPRPKGWTLLLVVAEASLELVPRELWGRPSVLKHARRRGKRPGETLLDSSVHQEAVRLLPRSWARGRPDVVHVEALLALDSPLARAGALQLYIHTVADYAIRVDPSARLPRNYNRFVGLMEQVLTVGRAPPGAEKPLLEARPARLESLLSGLEPDRIVALDPEAGEERRAREVARELLGCRRPVLLVRGFRGGGFTEETLSLADKAYSLPGSRAMEPWTELYHVLAITADEAAMI